MGEHFIAQESLRSHNTRSSRSYSFKFLHVTKSSVCDILCNYDLSSQIVCYFFLSFAINISATPLPGTTVETRDFCFLYNPNVECY